MTTDQLSALLKWLHECDVATINEIIEVAKQVAADKSGKAPTPMTERPPIKVTEVNEKTPMPFGKFKGKPVGSVDESYLRWLYDQRPIKACPALEAYLAERFEPGKTQDQDDNL